MGRNYLKPIEKTKTAIEKALDYSQEFAKISKYKQDLVSYGFDSILLD